MLNSIVRLHWLTDRPPPPSAMPPGGSSPAASAISASDVAGLQHG
jgi:hypothetical protein